MAGEITIEITKESGQIKVEGHGFQGGQCLKDIDELSEILGMVTNQQRMKPEYQRHITVQRVKR